MATNEQKICKQVEFYFSDSNLPYDKFLWTLRANAVEGWIPIETIAGFKKMKMITEDFDAVVKALKEHESEIYEIDAEGKNIRRKSEVVQQDHVSRSIYVSGLPLVDVDAQDPVAELFKLQDKVEDLFGEHGKVLCVRLKKNIERPRKFKGSAYIEFESPEVAQKVAELKEVEFDGNKLEIMYKPKYHEMKSEQYKNTPGKKAKISFNAFRSQHFEQSNKRKNNGGFNKSSKKTKTEENKEEEKPLEEKKEEEKPLEEKKEE
ncbi:hypothetical protein EDC96DRAFT_454921 [Choanephora cucurbitarum]|nr:hypothetical protein EDC96DRAFT_454921 [Choanephora cucurbitarum]